MTTCIFFSCSASLQCIIVSPGKFFVRDVKMRSACQALVISIDDIECVRDYYTFIKYAVYPHKKW